jgi:hypothetical protein
MNLARFLNSCSYAFVFACLFALTGCAEPEVVVLVRFDSDAAQDSDGSLHQGMSVDAEAEPPPFDGGNSSTLDARVRPPFPELDSGLRACGSNEECKATEYCSLPSCTAKRGGTCMPIDSPCFESFNPGVCGCDGVKYFSDCLRKKQRVTADPSCAEHRACASTGPTTSTCPLYAVCSNLFTDRSCRPGQALRECWVLPTECPRVLGGEQYVACSAFGTGTETCVNACVAIWSQAPFAEVRSCGPPRGTGGPSGMDFM